MSEFYNEVIKNRYLNEIENSDSRHTISYVFKASKVTESILERDLYNFSDEDIYLVIKNVAPKSYNSARANINYIKSYILWSIKKGYRENNISPLDTIDNKKINKLVDRSSKIHFSEEEMDDLLSEFDNAQDQAMAQLWFEGAAIGREFSELKNLSYGDINWITNEIEVKDYVGTKRTVKVSNKCMRYLENAHKQRTYIFNYVKDGEIIESEKPLFQTDLIFKNVEHHRTKEKGITNGVVYTRLKAIKDKFNLEFFTKNGIVQSGQIHMAHQLFLRDGEIDTKQFHEIGERYNVSKIQNQNTGEWYPNTSLMKDYITSANLKDLYNLDVNIEYRTRNTK